LALPGYWEAVHRYWYSDNEISEPITSRACCNRNKFRLFGDGRKKKKIKGDVCPEAGIFRDLFSCTLNCDSSKVFG